MLGAEDYDVAESLQNIAEIYKATGDYARAEPLYLRALAILEKTTGAEAGFAITPQNLAEMYRLKGDYARAEPLYQRSLATSKKTLGANHPLIANGLNNFALLSEAKGDRAQAVRYLKRASDIREHNLTLILGVGSESQKRRYMASLTIATDSSLSLLGRATTLDAESSRLAMTIILRRKGRVLDALSNQMGALHLRLNPQDRVLLDKLDAARAQLAGLVLKGADEPNLPQRRAAISRLENEAEGLEAQISARSAEFRSQVQPMTLESVQNELPQDAALVELVLYRKRNPRGKIETERLGENHYAACVLQHQGVI